MTARASFRACALLLFLALFSHSTTRAEYYAVPSASVLAAQAIVPGLPSGGATAIPTEIPVPVAEEVPEQTNPDDPSDAPFDLSPDPNLATTVPQSHAAATSLPLLSELPVGTVLPAAEVKTVYPKNFVLSPQDTAQDMDEPQQSLPQSSDLSELANAKPLVCSLNPPFTINPYGTKAASICRSYLYMNSNRTKVASCTASFVTSSHVVTAGHCVAASRKYLPVAVNGRYGTVCCKTLNNTSADNCPTGYGFDVIQVTTTAGWLNSGAASNDGAVLKVRRPSNVVSGVGVAQKYATASPFCPQNNLTFAGYPGNSGPIINYLSGCQAAWKDRLTFTTTGGIANCVNTTNLPSYSFLASSCGGMSGGPLINPPTNTIWGIHTQGSPICISRKSYAGFSAITNSNTSWGVSIAALIRAIP